MSTATPRDPRELHFTALTKPQRLLVLSILETGEPLYWVTGYARSMDTLVRKGWLRSGWRGRTAKRAERWLTARGLAAVRAWVVGRG